MFQRKKDMNSQLHSFQTITFYIKTIEKITKIMKLYKSFDNVKYTTDKN